MITSYCYGHLAELVEGNWRYVDTKESISIARPCKKCGKLPTPEGYDGCLAYIPNAVSVCCGHGVSKPILKFRRGYG